MAEDFILLMDQGFDCLGVHTPFPDLARLYELVKVCRPTVAVEVGTWAGGTARIMALVSKVTFCVDSWKGIPEMSVIPPRHAFKTFCRNMGNFLMTRVIPLVGQSLDWADVWTGDIDFLFIDADHNYEAVKADIMAWAPHVRAGGIICGHDYTAHAPMTGNWLFNDVHPGVAQAVDEIFPDRVLVPDSSIWSVVKE